MSQLMDHLNDVGPGWHKILFQLHYDIAKLDPAYEVVQVKEKWGGLRVYLRDEGHEIQPLLNAAEVESLKTCERCGEPGETGGLRSSMGPGWIKTLCGLHRMERANQWSTDTGSPRSTDPGPDLR